MVSMVASSDYLTSVNYVTVYPTHEYAACNEAIATEYPLLQGSWDDPAINMVFKQLNDIKLQDLDPKYIQKQAKKATGLEARSSDLVVIDILHDQRFSNPRTSKLSDYGIKSRSLHSHFWFWGDVYSSRLDARILHRADVVTPPAAEGEQFTALARSSDQPMTVHTTCMAGYNLMFESLNHMEQGWMRRALRRTHTILHLPFICPAGFNPEYHLGIVQSSWLAPPLLCGVCIDAYSGPDLVCRTQLTSCSTYIDCWYSPKYPAIEVKTIPVDIRFTEQIEGRVLREPDLATERIAELEASLQEARAYCQQQKEKLDAMVRLYNRTMRKRKYSVEQMASEDSQLLGGSGLDSKSVDLIACISGRAVRVYVDTLCYPIAVSTPKIRFFISEPVFGAGFQFQHMGRTFNTLQEWRAYYEPIIARLDSPDASA